MNLYELFYFNGLNSIYSQIYFVLYENHDIMKKIVNFLNFTLKRGLRFFIYYYAELLFVDVDFLLMVT